MHISGSQENGTDESICRTGIEPQAWRADSWTHGGRRSGTNWESSFETYALTCKPGNWWEAAVERRKLRKGWDWVRRELQVGEDLRTCLADSH